MDYGDHLDWEVVDDWAELRQKLPDRRFWLFTKFATQLAWEPRYQQQDVLVFGSESQGLPERLRVENPAGCVKFPMREEVRSLNLASTANAACRASSSSSATSPAAITAQTSTASSEQQQASDESLVRIPRYIWPDNSHQAFQPRRAANVWGGGRRWSRLWSPGTRRPASGTWGMHENHCAGQQHQRPAERLQAHHR